MDGIGSWGRSWSGVSGMPNKKADIYTDYATREIVVTDGRKEVFRRPRNEQHVHAAHCIYMCVKYGEDEAKGGR